MRGEILLNLVDPAQNGGLEYIGRIFAHDLDKAGDRVPRQRRGQGTASHIVIETADARIERPQCDVKLQNAVEPFGQRAHQNIGVFFEKPAQNQRFGVGEQEIAAPGCRVT